MWQQLTKKYLGSTIPILNIHGVINSQIAQKVSYRISLIKPSRAVALAVSINSAGGYPAQGLIISNKIKQFASKNNLKIITFVRTMATSGAYYILSSGDHVCADTTSLVGATGTILSKWQTQGAFNLTGIENKRIMSNNNSLRECLHPYNTLTTQQREELQKVCDWTHQRLINLIRKNRGQKIKDWNDIQKGVLMNGEQAKNKGLVDEVGSMVSILQKYYPGSRLQNQIRYRKSISIFQR